MENLPVYVSCVFMFVTLLTVWLFYKATRGSGTVLGIVLVWLVLQGSIAFTGFYLVTNTLPPRLILLMGPAFLAIALLFFTKKGRNYIDSLDERYLTWLHIVRVPVEFILLGLFMYELVPQLMTFEGRNFDILSGITAPLVAYYGYSRHKLGKNSLLIWNFICLGLLLNIVINAILSVPFTFQQFAFDQPNVGVLYFPFIWLPGFIVPVVLFSHLVCIRKLKTQGSQRFMM